MSDLAIFKTFGKGHREPIIKGKRAVIYTRVSTKDQTENLSLATQRKYCLDYAQKNGYVIVNSFGQTHESASNDERAAFKEMLSFVKRSKEQISYIIVYSYDRFSRNENSFWLTSQLRTLSIEILSVTQVIDTTSPAGQMQQRLYYAFNQFENELRRDRTKAGTKEMLLLGNWPTKPPLGYDSQKINGRRTIVPNAKGLVLRQVFEWKKVEGLSLDAIRIRLAQKGITLCKQRVAAILRNPFYAGLISHNMLDGEVVPGNHEPLISKELFLQVNGILESNNHGYSVKEENEALPLKRFLKCAKCGQSLHGYIVKKKGIHYYKCSTLGECIDTAIDFALNMPKKWLSANYHIKQRLQFLLFPEGILYDREMDKSRTTRVNSVFLYLAYLKQLILKQERGIPALQLDYSSLSRSVAGAELIFPFR